VRRAVIVNVLCALLLPAAVHPARAQQPSPQLSSVEQSLTSYLVPASTLPAGVEQSNVTGLENAALAEQTVDPADVQKIVDRARLDGLEQDLWRTSSGLDDIHVDISIFRDAAGASSDVSDPVELAPVSPTPVTAPRAVDGSAAYLFKTARFDGTAIAFASGRLEVLVLEFASSGTASMEHILPVAKLAATQAATPPPAPAQSDLDVLTTETGPDSVLHDAYGILMKDYVTPLNPSDVLGGAYDAAAQSLDRAGISGAPAAPAITAQDVDGAWSQFLPAYQQLETLAGDSGRRDLSYAAASGMYDSLNCHTGFFWPAFYATAIASEDGEGVAEVGVVTRNFSGARDVIVHIQPDSPAADAGLKLGDRVAALDHQTRADLGRNFGELYYGDPGSTVTMTIERLGMPVPFDVTVVRRLVPASIERHRVLPGGVGLIELDRFPIGDEARHRLNQALSDFAAAGVQSWILDLRYNDGGSASSLDEVAGLFVGPDDLLMTSKTQDGSVDTDRSLGQAVAGQQPLVVLIGPHTASAAELLAQSLKDLGRATLAGETSAGCVNGGRPAGLLDGSGVFVSTFQAFAGPKKVTLEHAGVQPDMSVSLSRDDVVAGADPQLDAAVALLTGTVQAAQTAPAPTSSPGP